MLGAAQLGALAAAGVAEVVCGAVPRAAVLATGTELRRPGEPLGPGEVYEANGLILEAQLGSAGASSSAWRLSPTTRTPIARRWRAGSSTTCS